MDLLNNDMSEFEKEIDLINESVGDFGIKPNQKYKKNGTKSYVRIDKVKNGVVYFNFGNSSNKFIGKINKLNISSFLKNYIKVK